MAAPCTLSSVTLTEGWQFKQKDDDAENAWLDVKKVPTNVHLDLMEHGKYVSACCRSIKASHVHFK
jgi:beta-mannosidase